MTQATRTHIDRRTALLGAIAAPAAFAGPALAAGPEPDAELLELGRQWREAQQRGWTPP